MTGGGDTTRDAEHWEELQSLFARFEDTAPAEREAAVKAVCANEYVCRRVLELLAAADLVTHVEPNAAKRRADTFIGNYRLIREIGSGGIGAVYLAERLVDGVTLRSALKVLAPHSVDASFVERFYREQQHLAALDHPNITRLFDAGWADNGQPYLVMEYVEGSHVDDYCDERIVGITDRLRLFRQICEAVSHAHRNLIVHLDLKPSNVLVSGAGVVKLLDFGTSKLIRVDGDSTSTLMATPAYASPEQLLNLPVSTASDVYGLGAMLYVLLVGRAPFQNTSAAARTEAAVRAQEPAPIFKAVTDEAATARGLSRARLSQTLQGDLAAIVACCLRSEPQERYASADALSADIERYLACKPVLARRRSVTYATMKFLRRNRVSVSLSIAAAMSLALLLGYAWTQQQSALRQAERAVQMQTFLSSLFKMANPNYTGKPVATVPDFLSVGMARLPDYLHDPSDLRAAELSLAESMFESASYADARVAFAKIAAEAKAAGDGAVEAEAQIYASAVEFQDGQTAKGRELSAAAFELARAPSIPPRIRVLSEIYYAYNEDNNGYRTPRTLELLRAAVRECRDLQLPAHETALALSYLAGDLVLRGSDLEAQPIFEQLLAVYRNDPLSLCDRSETYGWLAWIADASGHVDDSLPLYRKAYDGYVACAGADSRGALDQLPYWADALIKSGRAADAVTMLEAALPDWRRVAGHSVDHSDMLYFVARAYLAVGRNADAEKYAAELLAVLKGNLSPESRDVGAAHMIMGEALAAQHRDAEARPHAAEAVRLLVASAVSPYGKQQGEEAKHLLAHVSQ